MFNNGKRILSCFTGRGIGDNLIVTEAVAGMLMIVLQYCADPQLHSLFVESLLPLRDHLYKDFFTVIAYGPPNTKIPAVSLLFHYWPQLQSLLVGGGNFTSSYVIQPWQIPKCQRSHCINKIARSSASKVTTLLLLVDATLAVLICVLPLVLLLLLISTTN